MPMAEGMAQGLLSGGSLVNRAATTVAASSVSSATTYNTLTFAPRYSGPPREQMDELELARLRELAAERQRRYRARRRQERAA